MNLRHKAAFATKKTLRVNVKADGAASIENEPEKEISGVGIKPTDCSKDDKEVTEHVDVEEFTDEHGNVIVKTKKTVVTKTRHEEGLNEMEIKLD